MICIFESSSIPSPENICGTSQSCSFESVSKLTCPFPGLAASLLDRSPATVKVGLGMLEGSANGKMVNDTCEVRAKQLAHGIPVLHSYAYSEPCFVIPLPNLLRLRIR